MTTPDPLDVELAALLADYPHPGEWELFHAPMVRCRTCWAEGSYWDAPCTVDTAAEVHLAHWRAVHGPQAGPPPDRTDPDWQS